MDPAYQYAYSNARKKWREACEGASCDRYKNCTMDTGQITEGS